MNEYFMKKIPILLLLLLFCPSMVTMASEIQQSVRTAEDVLLKLEERERTLATFIARFKQIQENSLFAQSQISEGTIFFDQGGKLLMKMTTPEAYLVFIANQEMIIGVPGSSSYRQKRLPGGNNFFKQAMGIDGLKNRYDTRMISAPAKESCELELKPLKRSRRTPFSTIRVRINTLEWLPEMIHLEESDNDVTTFHLEFISINQPLPDGIFDIPVPDKKILSPQGSHAIK
jgi:outer membrane lipoprotein-sorting protein